MIDCSSGGAGRDQRVEHVARAMIGCFGTRALSVATNQMDAARDSEGTIRISWNGIAAKIADLQLDADTLEIIPALHQAPPPSAAENGRRPQPN